MICPYCQTQNRADARICSTCGYLLASGPPLANAGGRRVGEAKRVPKRPVSLLERMENSKKGIAVVFTIVVVVILLAFYLTVQIHEDEAYLSPQILYRYASGSGSTPPEVQIWGDVYNWGDSEGSCRLRIVISDDDGHRLTDAFNVGPVPPHGSVAVSKTYEWNYLYDPVEHPTAPVIVSVSL
jgi:hypothetical protein